jgi:hypothetical protein
MRAASEAVANLHVLVQINTELALVDAKRVAGYFLVWIAALGTYFLDVILIAAVAEYFARRVYTSPFMVAFARTIVPAAILVVELLISSQRSFHQEDANEFGNSRGRWIWTFFTLLILCVLPSMIIATHFASLPTKLTPALEGIYRYQLLGLIAICLVLHGAVLHGGRLALEAQAYLWFKLRTIRLTGRVRSGQNQFDEAATAATNAYFEHMRLIREFNVQFPDAQVTPGPFDKLTRQLLQARLGDERDGSAMSESELPFVAQLSGYDKANVM